jgi:AcrR family transcriptional regulator
MAPQIIDKAKRPRGRPRSFDRAEALGKATTLFWEQGYEGTSFDDLIGAMNISASSFYISFGSKEKLYREATDAFMQASESWFFAVLNDKALSTRTAFERVLDAVAAEFTRPGMPSGCMISLAAAHGPPGLAGLRQMMTEHRNTSESSFANRLRTGIANGDLPAGTDIESLAAYFSAIVRGLAVQARDGATRDRLKQIITLAMRVWPPKQVRRQPRLGDTGH